jgi:hypothetical protein
MEPKLELRLATPALKGSGSKDLQSASVEQMESGAADPPFAQVRTACYHKMYHVLQTHTHSMEDLGILNPLTQREYDRKIITIYER